MFLKSLRVLLSILFVLGSAGMVAAQSDPFGTVDLVYVDSVKAGPGEDVSVGFNVRNDEALGSLSIPVVYDSEILTLKSIKFTGSRVEYLNTRLITPESVEEIAGHFVVAVIQLLEDPIPAGDGLIFTAVFKLDDSVTIGTSTPIDTLFYPPGGELLLIGGDPQSSIRPAFQGGQVVVGERNRRPTFASMPDQYVLEGDTLGLTITVSDPDQDDLTLAVTNKPIGVGFTDNGDGTATITWVPAYVGPSSADGSPFSIGLWASDGDLSTEHELLINVVNTNRAPVIDAPAEVTVEAGEQLKVSLSAIDPDFEDVTWSCEELPDGAALTGTNPAEFTWQSNITDSGSFGLRFTAADPQGLADTTDITVTVTAVALYTLYLDSVEAFPSEDVEFDILLDNKFPVTSFNALFNYDPSALSLLSLTNDGTRCENFEYFTYTDDENGVAGNVRVHGVADIGGGTPILEAGDGSIGLCRFHTSGNLAYAGMDLPVVFRFLDTPTDNDNTLTDSTAVKILQEDIAYINGSVRIHDIGQINIGDINLNGLAAEIGDVIYFTNYFINPTLYTFNALQYANSDVNRDNIAATVSDLVALINMVVDGKVAGKEEIGAEEELSAVVSAVSKDGGAVFSYETGFDVGAALVVFECDGKLNDEMFYSLPRGMDFDFSQNGSIVTVLLYSLEGQVMPSGVTELFTVEGLKEFTIVEAGLGSADGQYVRVALSGDDTPAEELPLDYALEQNYPNPFNPQTHIEFSLPTTSRVELTVYNVLGRRVKQLAAGEYPAGRHTIVWDGTDQNDQTVASGAYFYRLEAGSHSFTHKMLLLK